MDELFIKEKKQTENRGHSKSFWVEVFSVLAGAIALLFIFGAQYATGELGFTASVEKNQVEPGESFFVDLSQPIAASAVEKNFAIEPAADVELRWSNNYQRLEIRPKDSFRPGTNYSFEVNPQSALSFSRIFGNQRAPGKLNVSVETEPKVSFMSPVSGDPNVKIDSAIKIIFDKPTTGYDVNFVVDPFSSFDLSYDDAKKDFTIIPKAKFDFSRDYAVSVKIAPSRAKIPAKEMPEVYRANFKTEPSPPPPPPVEEVILPEKNNPNEVAAAQVATPEAKIKEGKYIDINLSKQQLSLFENGERLGTYKVSSGKRGMATPTGTFKVMSKAGRAYSKKYNLYMPYWMQFTGAGHGIHELPEWKSGYKEGANHLGTPVSHGCVRLGVGPAAKVYGWSDAGTPIVIHY